MSTICYFFIFEQLLLCYFSHRVWNFLNEKIAFIQRDELLLLGGVIKLKEITKINIGVILYRIKQLTKAGHVYNEMLFMIQAM